MKTIALTQGKFTIVDDDVYDIVNKYKWHYANVGYAASRIKGRIVLMHRLILNATKGEYIDHINGNKLDNQVNNLRKCTNAQNAFNSKRPCTNSSGYKGVSYSSSRKKWEAKIKFQQKTIHLGRHNTAEDAAKAYNNAAIKYFGKFARINDI